MITVSVIPEEAKRVIKTHRVTRTSSYHVARFCFARFHFKIYLKFYTSV
jgi:hypothetical protein